jgi:hypothetical protein
MSEQKPAMKLKNLSIELQRWGENEGKYLGKIEYDGVKGSVSMLLDPRVSEALLMCVGETITRFASEAAKEVENSIVQSLQEAKQPKALEAA